MNEKEQFEEGAWNQYQDEVKKYPCLEEITKEELFCFEAGRYYRQDMYYHWITWQAWEKIAKQDEKEVVEALIETTMKMEEESIAHHWDKICPARSRMINNII